MNYDLRIGERCDYFTLADDMAVGDIGQIVYNGKDTLEGQWVLRLKNFYQSLSCPDQAWDNMVGWRVRPLAVGEKLIIIGRPRW